MRNVLAHETSAGVNANIVIIILGLKGTMCKMVSPPGVANLLQ